jgi:transcription termination factor NusA
MSTPDESVEAMFQRTLHVSPELARRLVAGGCTSVEEVAYVPHTELVEVSGLTGAQASVLRRVARAYLANVDM